MWAFFWIDHAEYSLATINERADTMRVNIENCARLLKPAKDDHSPGCKHMFDELVKNLKEARDRYMGGDASVIDELFGLYVFSDGVRYSRPKPQIQWTTDPPEKEGFYWVKLDGATAVPMVVLCAEWDDETHWFFGNHTLRWASELNIQRSTEPMEVPE